MNNKELEATRRLLKAKGVSDDQIEATLDVVREQNKTEKWDSVRSWIAVVTGIIAFIVSVLVAIFK